MIGRLVGRFAVVVVLALSGCVVRPSVEIRPFDGPSATEPNGVAKYTDFWDAMARRDLSYVRNHRVSEEQRQYADALASLDRGDTDRGLATARELYQKSSDAAVHKKARKLLNTVYLSQWRWDLLILPDPNEVLSKDEATAESFAEHLTRLPLQSCEFRQPMAQIQIRRDKNIGLIFLPVQINGQSRSLILDTGADLTLLASDVASACGVELMPGSSYDQRTMDSEVGAKVGRVDRLEIGDLTIRSHPVLIFRTQDMLTPKMRVDGVLGWAAIRTMDIEVDYGNSTVTIRKPEPRKDVEMNVLPCHNLIVRTRTPGGIPALVWFDTASTGSFFYKAGLPYLGLESKGNTRYSLVAPGSQRSIDSKVVATMSLVFGSAQIQWTNMMEAPNQDDEALAFRPVCILGSDIFREGGHVRIDGTNRRVDFWWDGLCGPAGKSAIGGM